MWAKHGAIERTDMLSSFQIGNKLIEICLQLRNVKLFLLRCFSLIFLIFLHSSNNIWISACVRWIRPLFSQRKNSDNAIEVRVWMRKNGLDFNDGIRQLFNRVSMNNYPMRVCFVFFFHIQTNIIIIVWVFWCSVLNPIGSSMFRCFFFLCILLKTVCIGKTNDNDEADATIIWLIWILI